MEGKVKGVMGRLSQMREDMYVSNEEAYMALLQDIEERKKSSSKKVRTSRFTRVVLVYYCHNGSSTPPVAS